MIKIVLYLLIFSFPLIIYSQEDLFEEDFKMVGDTVCFSYRFFPGDTLIYFVNSFDSIIVDFDTPLLRNRLERYLIICDSIGSNGNYYLSQTLLNYTGLETKVDSENVERTKSPWIGRIVRYEIDSLGRRYSWSVDDANLGAINPGGAFQPHILFYLGANCKRVNESWNVEYLEDLPENGVPTPLVRQASLFRANESGDTLERKCIRLEYIKTGQGSMAINTETDDFKVTSILNGFGYLHLDSVLGIPIHYFATIEQKLTITLADGTVKPGWHFLESNFTLEYINENNRLSFRKSNGTKRRTN